MCHRLSQCTLLKAFSKTTKLTQSCLCHSMHCSMMLRRVEIWSVHPFPFRNPACSLLSCWFTVSAFCWMMILARILLGTGSKVIPRQLLQLLKAPFFGIFTVTPSVQSLGNFFLNQMSVKSSWSRSAASCGFALLYFQLLFE